jgi:hypothetical protein
MEWIGPGNPQWSLSMARATFPKDPNQRAKAILDLATGATSIVEEKPISILGRVAGLKSLHARQIKLKAKRRAALFHKAAIARS